jgi:hypothetical protein
MNKEIFFRIITAITFILFLLIFPFFTIDGWGIFFMPTFVMGAAR